MSTKTETVDLTWVEFSEDDSPACDTQRGSCTREAIWQGVWNWYHNPGCTPEPGPVCQVHKDIFDAQPTYHNFVRCRNHDMFTSCGEFIRWERFRK